MTYLQHVPNKELEEKIRDMFYYEPTKVLDAL